MAQFSFQDKRIGQVLAAFVVFFILTSPALAGSQARGFFSFLGDGIDSIGTFLDGFFNSEPN